MREAPNNQPARFPTTRLSLILAASGEPTPQSQEALSTLCQIYWYPIYAYLRRRGYAADEAEDYTQGFFTLVLEKHYLRDFQHERGRFRSFLIGSIKHFLANHQNWERAQKRGGGVSAISLDEVIQAGEIRYGREPLDALTRSHGFPH